MGKKLFVYIITILLVLSCSESEYDSSRENSLNKRYLSVSTKALAFKAIESSQNIKVEADQTAWRIDVPVKWLEVTPISGNSSALVKVTAQVNKSADASRACIINVSSNESDWEQTFPISVSQEKNAPYIIAKESSVTCSALQQEIVIPIVANTEYSIDNTAPDWLRIKTISDSCVVVKLNENNTDNERIALLTLKSKSYSGCNASITVRQKLANISSTSNTVHFGHTASSTTIFLNSEAAWRATSTSWVSVSPSDGTAGKTEITISVPDNASANKRSASAYFIVSEGNSIEIPIEQDGVVLNVSANVLQFGSYEESKNIDIVSNEKWLVKSKPEWVNVNTSEGEDNGNIKISVQENNTTNVRRGEIVIATIDDVVSQTIQIEQSAKTVDFSGADLSFNYGEGSQSFSFVTDGKWEILTESDWINVDKTTGRGDAVINVTVKENNTQDDREGQVVIVIAGERRVVNVKQGKKYVTLSSSAFSFDANEGKVLLNVASNTQWNVSVEEGKEWISLSSHVGSGNSDVIINVSENKTVSRRKGKIAVTIPNVKTYLIEVIQERKFIKTDMQSVDFLQSGGEISFTVTSDGTYKVTRLGDWFGYTRHGDVITVIAPKNVTGIERNGAIELTLTNIEGSLTLLVPVRQK